MILDNPHLPRYSRLAGRTPGVWDECCGQVGGWLTAFVPALCEPVELFVRNAKSGSVTLELVRVRDLSHDWVHGLAWRRVPRTDTGFDIQH